MYIQQHGAAGGSSFISGHKGCIAVDETGKTTNQSIHYSGKKFTDTVMIDGAGYKWTTEKEEHVGMPTFDGKGIMEGNIENEYCKITLIV